MHKVRLRDIAEKMGVSAAAVSMALRNHPRISQKRRLEIQRVAGEMGYQPDPMMQGLVRHRWSQSDAIRQCNIAFLHNLKSGNSIPKEQQIAESWHGCEARALSLGYTAFPFTVVGKESSQKRLSKTLTERGVRGVIVGGNLNAHPYFHLDWSLFSVVVLGNNLYTPEFNSVRFDHHWDILKSCRELRRQKFRRVGLLLDTLNDQRDFHRWRSTFALCKEMYGFEHTSVHLEKNIGAGFIKWIKREKLDSMIGASWHFQKIKEFSNLNLGLVALRANDTEMGLIKNFNRLGSISMEKLHHLIQLGQRGIPKDPEMTFIKGYWSNGNP